MPDRYSTLERATLQPAAPGASGARPPGRIKIAQAQLKGHGFNIGHAPNGQLSPGTTNAIRAFQLHKGLSATGTLDQRTSDALAKSPSTTGRTVGSRRMSGGPTLVHRARGQGAPHSQTRSGTHHTTSLGSSSPTKGEGSMQDKSQWESAGKRVPVIFQSNGPVAPGASVTIPVQPQVPFRGENFVVDAATGLFFSVVSFKVGVPDQNAGGAGNIPCSIFPPNQTGAVDYEMDLADSGTIMQLTVTNTDAVAHSFVGTLWGHEIQKSAA